MGSNYKIFRSTKLVTVYFFQFYRDLVGTLAILVSFKGIATIHINKEKATIYIRFAKRLQNLNYTPRTIYN